MIKQNILEKEQITKVRRRLRQVANRWEKLNTSDQSPYERYIGYNKLANKLNINDYSNIFFILIHYFLYLPDNFD